MRGPGGAKRRVNGHLLRRPLAAHAGTTRWVDAPLAGVAREGPRTSIVLAAKSFRQADAPRPVDQPFSIQEPEGEFLVVPRRAHRHRQRPAVDADLERLLDGDFVPLPSRTTVAIIPAASGSVALSLTRAGWPSGSRAGSRSGP